MSGSIYGHSIFGNQQNVLLDASNYSKGENDALTIQKNRLMLDRAQMENTADQAFRSAAPGAIGGDPAALNAAIAADPDRGMALQTQIAALDAGKRKKALENTTYLGQGAAALLGLPEDEAARQYPGMIAGFKARGIDVSSLPPSYPGHAAARSFAASLTPIKDQLERLDNQIVPAGDMSQPRGLRNNNPLNIEAGQFTQSMPGFKGSDGRFAVFESPEQGIAAADTLLMRYAGEGRNTPAKIIEKWAPAGDGNNVSAYAGSVARALGIGPNDPIPMEDPAARRALIDAMSAVENGKRGPQPLVRQGNGMPVTKDAQPGMMWAQGPGGQRVQMPIPGAVPVSKPPFGMQEGPDGTVQNRPGYVQALAEQNVAKAEGKPPTDEQNKAALYSSRMAEAEAIIQQVGEAGTGWGGAYNKAASAVPVVGNAVVSENFQRLEQAQRNFINATLRRESGAVIADSEFDNAKKQYFPQPGDGTEVLKQKAQNRKTAIEEIKAAAGPAAPRVSERQAATRTVARTGKLPDGRRVVQYSDGTTEVQ